MSEWDDRDYVLDYLNSNYSLAKTYQNLFNSDWVIGCGYLRQGNYLQAGYYFDWAGQSLYTCLSRLILYSMAEDWKYEFFIPSILDKFTIGSWKGIIEAWIKNDFEARTWTIATLDRMRQIIWDEPFNVVWASRPEDKQGEL